jgi:secondary thiamine-phosphate synthase enzyme
MKTLTVKSSLKEELIDITSQILKIIRDSKIENGICLIYTPHTTAAITINENADPDVKSDIIKGLDSLKLEQVCFDHSEGNSPAHIKSSLVGCSESLIIDKGSPVLGTWQGIFFCEFDGPRSRKVYVKILGD